MDSRPTRQQLRAYSAGDGKPPACPNESAVTETSKVSSPGGQEWELPGWEASAAAPICRHRQGRRRWKARMERRGDGQDIETKRREDWVAHSWARPAWAF